MFIGGKVAFSQSLLRWAWVQCSAVVLNGSLTSQEIVAGARSGFSVVAPTRGAFVPKLGMTAFDGASNGSGYTMVFVLGSTKRTLIVFPNGEEESMVRVGQQGVVAEPSLPSLSLSVSS